MDLQSIQQRKRRYWIDKGDLYASWLQIALHHDANG